MYKIKDGIFIEGGNYSIVVHDDLARECEKAKVVSVCFTRTLCFVATLDNGDAYAHVWCLDRTSAKTMWKTEVEGCNSIPAVGLPSQDPSVLEIVVHDDQVALFGKTPSCQQFSYAFRAETGERLFEFRTCGR